MDAIQRNLLGNTGLDVSALGMGCVKLGSGAASDTRRHATRVVHAALDAGIRLFDTADAYGAGRSEAVLGAALEGRRDGVVIATKVGYRFRERRHLPSVGRVMDRVAGRRAYAEQDFSPAALRAAVIASLRRLRVDRIDLLQLHGPPDPTELGSLDELSALVDDGLVTAIGVGCESLGSATAWIDDGQVGSVQLPCGVLDPQAVTTLIPTARSSGMGVLARGVLGGGVLARFVRGQDTGLDTERQTRLDRLAAVGADAGSDPMQIAMWYGRLAVAADAVLIGMSSVAQVHEAMRMWTAPPPTGLLAQVSAVVNEGAA